jgi:type IV pilus assembly protein PilA
MAQQQQPPQQLGPGWQPPPAGPQKGMGVGLIILIVVVVLIVPMVGIMAVLGIYGTRKYIANAKQAEARNVLGQIAKDAVVAYEGGDRKRICPSASARIPADRNAVSGKKYLASSSEWQTDRAANAGFACLRFAMATPQYYQYEYEATPTSFVARAYGDLNGDGVFSTFEIKGQVVGDSLLIAPSILETDPDE